jgi:hypothetical protein
MRVIVQAAQQAAAVAAQGGGGAQPASNPAGPAASPQPAVINHEPLSDRIPIAPRRKGR